MSRIIRICHPLFLALIFSPGPQSSDKYLTLKVSDTAGGKVDQIAITCKENCKSEGAQNGLIKLILPPQTTAAVSITLEIVKHSDHPDWMIVSPAGGRVPESSIDGKSDNIVSVTVMRIGRDDWDSAHHYDELAGRYFEQAKYAEAEALGQKALEIAEKVFGQEHAETAEILRHMAFIYGGQKRYAEAEAYYNRALKLYDKAQPEHTETAETLLNLAGIYHHQEKYEEMAPLYKRAFDIYEKALGFEAQETETCFNYLAQLYLGNSQFEELGRFYKHALEFYEREGDGMMSDKRRKNMISLLEKYGEFLWQEYKPTHNKDEAMKLLGRAYDFKEGAKNSGAKARPDAKQQFRRYLRTLGHHGLLKEPDFEIREYKHVLLSKYLPDYKFYVPYVPASFVWNEKNNTFKLDYGQPWFGVHLGVADREKLLTVFHNGVIGDYEKSMQTLAHDFLIKARIKRFAPARTDKEMQEITKLFLILNCLKGHGGPEEVKPDKNGNPVVRDFSISDFKVKREGGKTTVIYNVEDDMRKLECYLTFDSQGNITGGKASGMVKGSFTR
jgi:tetratricopeptide (TPR) repeat protein